MTNIDEMGRVFQLEIDTLIKVRDSLNDTYSQAADLIFACTGKVVATGMGKSGFVAQKIASTMVSTGTPAIFLHPGDAMHGDVGIIGSEDVVLAISKSGETEEILGLLPYLRKVGVPLLSVTANAQSSLAKASEHVLYTPVAVEACPLNLAPTASTTAALVVGDALAMALMKMRGFQPEQFALFHPGGQLGKRLLTTVADIMRGGEDNPVVRSTDPVPDMLSQITQKRSGAVSVVDQHGKLLGLITDYDIRKVLADGLDIFSLEITDIMNPHATSINSDENAFSALTLMEDRESAFLVLPVLDRASENVIGMLHIHDLVASGL